MITITEKNGLSVAYRGRTVFSHTEKTPFVTACAADYSYKSAHGNFHIKEKLLSREPLAAYELSEVSETGAKIRFFACGGASLFVRIEENNGALTFFFTPSDDKLAFEFCLTADLGEGIFGGGEQFRKLNMKGEKIANFVSEHIVVKPIVQKTVFRFLPYREKKHSEIETYAPMTTYVSGNKYALRFDASDYGVADFSRENYSVFRFARCPKSLLYVAGADFKEIGRLLNSDLPSNERLPDWAHDGMIIGVQGGIDRAERKADEAISAGAKICGVWCQDWCGKKVTAVGKQVYWNWEYDDERYGELAVRIAALKEKGVHFLAYINPYLVKDGNLYNFCKNKGYLIKNRRGEIYHVKSTTFDAGMFDLTNPDAVNYIRNVVIKKNMLDLGVDGYMADFGEYLPVDCVLHSGNPEELHNE